MAGSPKCRSGVTRKRELRAFELSCRGKTLRQIAEILEQEGLGKVTHQAVHKMLVRVGKRVEQQMQAELPSMRVRQLARYDAIHSEAMDAWEKSKEDTQVITTETTRQDIPDSQGGTIQGAPERVKAVIRKEGQSGEAKHLAVALKALERQDKLTGLERLEQPELDLRREEEPPIARLSDEELERLAGGPLEDISKGKEEALPAAQPAVETPAASPEPAVVPEETPPQTLGDVQPPPVPTQDVCDDEEDGVVDWKAFLVDARDKSNLAETPEEKSARLRKKSDDVLRQYIDF